MPHINLFGDKLTQATIVQDDINVSQSEDKSLITKIVEEANTGIKIKSSVDKFGNAVAAGTGHVTLETDLNFIRAQMLALNGITNNNGIMELGGPLTKNTLFTGNNFNMRLINGRLGIGTADFTPDVMLHLKKATPDGFIWLEGSAPSLRMLDGNPASLLNIVWAGATANNHFIAGSTPGSQVMINYLGDFLFAANAMNRNHTVDMKIATSGNIIMGSLVDNGQKLQVAGGVSVSGLAGTGTRMVVADASGVLSTQTMPNSGITTETDPTVPEHVKAITTTNISNWNTAFGWGNHVGLYRPISYVPSWTEVTGRPTFETVATSGSYNDLTNKPTIPTYSGTNFIVNGTTQQASANFNISGAGTIGGNLTLSNTSNLFFGNGNAKIYQDSNSVLIYSFNPAIVLGGVKVMNKVGNATHLSVTESAGNVLIATSVDAGYKLDVNGDSRVTGKLYLNYPAATGQYLWYAPDGYIGSSGSFRAASGDYYGAIYSTQAKLHIDYYGHTFTAGPTPNGSRIGLTMDMIANQTIANGYDSRAIKFGFTATAAHTAANTLGGATFYVADDSIVGNTIIGVTGVTTAGTNTNATRVGGHFIAPLQSLVVSTNGSTGGTSAAAIDFTYQSAIASKIARIQAVVANGGGGALHFQTPTNGVADPYTSKMIITRGGNVLIGTSTDGGFKLDVSGTTRLNGATTITGALNASTIASGVWNGTAIADAYIASASNWNAAFGWGNHAGIYRPISYVPSWTEITGKPAFHAVATSGNYNDLTNKPAIPTVPPDYDTLYYRKTQLQTSGQSAIHWGNITNAPSFLTSYTETDPTVPSHVKSITATDVTNWDTAFGWGNHTGLYRPVSYVPSWIEIVSKPAFATVATSGSYSDLTNRPTIPTYSGTNFIVNGTAQQTSANFNIDGIGIVGKLLVNTSTDAGFRLDVNGTARVQGDFSVASANGRTWGITGLTSGHTVYFQYGGDAQNRIENTYGQRPVFRAYHGLQVTNNNAGSQAAFQVYNQNSVRNIAEFRGSANTQVSAMDNAGNFTAASFVRTGGTSSQILMADGSTMTSTGLVTTSGMQTIDGFKTFSASFTSFQTVQTTYIGFADWGGFTTGIYSPNPGELALQSGGIEFFNMSSSGHVKLNAYGQGSFTGTIAKYLAVTPEGNVIETSGTSGGSSASLQVITDANYTIQASDTHIVFRSTTAARTLTMPTAAGNANRKLTVRNGGSSTVNLSQSVYESTGTPQSTLGAGKWLEFISDGTNWWTTAKN